MSAQLIAGILAESDGGGTPLLLALGPAGAAGIYWGLWRYYRNTDKSHSFETETRVESQPITGNDHKVDEIKGTRESRIQGDNLREYRKRVQRIRDDGS